MSSDVNHLASKVAYRFVQKETKKTQVQKLTRIIREGTGISKGKAEDIADAMVRGRDLKVLALQKDWPINEQGDIEGPRGSLSFDDAKRLI